MKTPLIKEDMNEILNQLVGYGFEMNRLLDRMVSQLNVKFVMSKTSELVHLKLAHQYPLISDMVSEYQASRNNMTIYPSTPIGDEDYSSPKEIFAKFLEKQIEYEELVKDAIRFANDNNDEPTYSFLIKFLRKLTKYTEQSILLSDKIEMFGDGNFAYMMFDTSVEDFFVL